MDYEKISIFKFDNYIDFLKVTAQSKSSSDSAGPEGETSTLDQWAKKLGYKSPSSLSMVLRGHRLPSREMIESISQDLRLKSIEKEYFYLLVKLERLSKQGKDISETLEQIYRLSHRRSDAFHVTHDQFAYISDWYHFAIKQLISSPDFKEDLEWIHRKLRRKVSPAKIRDAIQNLIKLGIVERSHDGQLKVSGKGLETPNDEVVSVALRNHHRGMIHRALESIDEQPMENRYLNAITLKLDKNRLKEAKEFITCFLREFGKQFSTEGVSDVYQLNIQLFEHTSDGSNLLEPEDGSK